MSNKPSILLDWQSVCFRMLRKHFENTYLSNHHSWSLTFLLASPVGDTFYWHFMCISRISPRSNLRCRSTSSFCPWPADRVPISREGQLFRCQRYYWTLMPWCLVVVTEANSDWLSHWLSMCQENFLWVTLRVVTPDANNKREKPAPLSYVFYSTLYRVVCSFENTKPSTCISRNSRHENGYFIS